MSLTDVYNVKFKKLMDDVDLLLDELHNIRDTYDELKPIFDEKDGDTADKDFLLTPVVDKDLFGNRDWHRDRYRPDQSLTGSTTAVVEACGLDHAHPRPYRNCGGAMEQQAARR